MVRVRVRVRVRRKGRGRGRVRGRARVGVRVGVGVTVAHDEQRDARGGGRVHDRRDEDGVERPWRLQHQPR